MSPVSANFARLSGSEAITLVRSGQATVEQIAQSCLQRYRQRDEQVKAWAYLDPEQVLRQAREIDALPVKGPLAGLMVGVKDVIQTYDMPTQYNSSIYKDHQANVDADCVKVLRTAGALIFGKTTTTEFAATVQGPKTSNAHDIERTPGGSSSGSGAAVGDFQCHVALGTQTGGSVIRPGSFNGVWAFKPTWGAISREGLKLYSISLDTLGLYARSSADLELLADLFKLADDQSAPTDFQLKGARIAICRTHVWPKAEVGTKSALQQAVQLLVEAGANVEDVETPDGFEALSGFHRKMMHGEGRAAFLGDYYHARDKLDSSLIGHVENVTNISRAEQLEAYDHIARMRPVWDRFASAYDFVLTPSTVGEAPKGLARTGDASFNSCWIALHVPVINVPGLKAKSGLPVGLSMVAARYQDRKLLAMSKAVGQLFDTATTDTPNLWSPVHLGALKLNHRIVLAPMTRNRATPSSIHPKTWVPNDLMIEYYTARSSPGGLLISEACPVSLLAASTPGIPGIFTEEQVEGWKRVTDAVHAKGSLIVCQLWHRGRNNTSDILGSQPVSASAVPESGNNRKTGMPNEVPRAMTIQEIAEVVQDFRVAAANARRAGFDGVELHGANGYLPDQFMHSNINLRTDAYGGSYQKRCRFLLEVVHAMSEAIGADRVGCRIAPFGLFNDTRGTERQEQWTYLCRVLGKIGLAYIHAIEPRFDEFKNEQEKMDGLDETASLSPYRFAALPVKMIAAGGYTWENTESAVAAREVDAVAFGRYYTSNPDLVDKLRSKQPWLKYHRPTFYGPFDDNAFGYTVAASVELASAVDFGASQL